MKTKTYLFSILMFFFFLEIIIASPVKAAIRIMPLGDSITQGSSSGVADEAFQVSFRKVLYDRLWEKGYVVDDEIFVGTQESGESVTDFDPDHEGHGGWTAEEIVKGRPVMDLDAGNLAIWLAERQPSIVLLHIGTN